MVRRGNRTPGRQPVHQNERHRTDEGTPGTPTGNAADDRAHQADERRHEATVRIPPGKNELRCGSDRRPHQQPSENDHRDPSGTLASKAGAIMPAPAAVVFRRGRCPMRTPV